MSRQGGAVRVCPSESKWTPLRATGIGSTYFGMTNYVGNFGS
jgi:hypothetical protein